MGSFNPLLQNNVLDTRRWATREGLPLAVVPWTERSYHGRLSQCSLGRMTPVDFEALAVALKAP